MSDEEDSDMERKLLNLKGLSFVRAVVAEADAATPPDAMTVDPDALNVFALARAVVMLDDMIVSLHRQVMDLRAAARAAGGER